MQSYVDIGNMTSFFTRMGIAMRPNVRPALTQIFADFTTGTRLANYVAPSADARTEALRRYLAVAETFLPVLEPGWWNFPAPKDIPPDLLLPFRDFVAKHNLTSGVPQIFATTGFGMHDIMGSLTLWVMRSFNVDMVRTLLGINPGFVPVGTNQDLYTAILKRLEPDILLSTTVIASKRTPNDGGVNLLVQNSETCKTTRISARRLLFTIPPTAANTASFNLDDVETDVLNSFNYSVSYVGVVSHPSLPTNTSIVNTPAAAQGSNFAAVIPAFPYNTRFDNYANSSFYRVIVVGDQRSFADDEQARRTVTDGFDRLVESGVIHVDQKGSQRREGELKFHLFTSHGMVNAWVPREVLESGFIQRLNALQGRRSTWYTGAAWSVHISTSLWIFTDTLLGRLVLGL